MGKKIIDFKAEAERLRRERSMAGEAVSRRLAWVQGVVEVLCSLVAAVIVFKILSALILQDDHWFYETLYFLIISIAFYTIAQGPEAVRLTRRITQWLFGRYINRPLVRFVEQFLASEPSNFLAERYPALSSLVADLTFRRSQHAALDKIIDEKKSANNEELLQKLKPKQDEIRKIANSHHVAKTEELAPLRDQLELEAEEIKILEAFLAYATELDCPSRA